MLLNYKGSVENAGDGQQAGELRRIHPRNPVSLRNRVSQSLTPTKTAIIDIFRSGMPASFRIWKDARYRVFTLL
ncbi:MAG: hypothetical protein MUC60_04695 [Oscillatoria sp. Prado101]|nr:hypothetical protein [Oscillatoria sp. Prado101]